MFSRTEKEVQFSVPNQGLSYPYCERCSKADEQEILVSVTPKVLKLSKDVSNPSSLVIKNRNAFPVFFKACTTNMNAFKPHPVTGKIAPLGYVTVTLPFYTPAIPIRHHEEVIIMISQTPFLQITATACQYCSKFHCTEDQKSQDRNLMRSFIQKQKSDDICTYDGKTICICKFPSSNGIDKEQEERERMCKKYHQESFDHKDAYQSHAVSKKLETSHKCECKEAYDRTRAEYTAYKGESAMNGRSESAYRKSLPADKSDFLQFQERKLKEESDIALQSTAKAKKKHSNEETQRTSKDMEERNRQQKDSFQDTEIKYYPKKPHILTRVVEAEGELETSEDEYMASVSDDSHIKKRKKLISETVVKTSDDVAEDQDEEFRSSAKKEAMTRRLSSLQNNMKDLMVKIDCKCSILLALSNISLFVLVLLLLGIGAFYFYSTFLVGHK